MMSPMIPSTKRIEIGSMAEPIVFPRISTAENMVPPTTVAASSPTTSSPRTIKLPNRMKLTVIRQARYMYIFFLSL